MYSHDNNFMSPRQSSPLAAWFVALMLLFCGNGALQAADLSGYWEGTWHGCTDGLKGTVKACITKCGPNCYHAKFSGRAFKIMPYKYDAMLTATEDPVTGKVHFKCNTKLPIWGCYWMNGTASDCSLCARYHTDDHVGFFKMQRVCCQ
ncbi:MAG: hypothetical protein O3C60_18535 [Planctomycetota bacterium]|nr:hypothetical protein [Planctomycetota bacterium]